MSVTSVQWAWQQHCVKACLITCNVCVHVCIHLSLSLSLTHCLALCVWVRLSVLSVVVLGNKVMMNG